MAGQVAPEVPHIYLSTACHHGQHAQCGVKQLERGDTSAPHCKYCDAVCVCTECRHEEQAVAEQRLLRHTVERITHRRPGSVP